MFRTIFEILDFLHYFWNFHRKTFPLFIFCHYRRLLVPNWSQAEDIRRKSESYLVARKLDEREKQIGERGKFAWVRKCCENVLSGCSIDSQNCELPRKILTTSLVTAWVFSLLFKYVQETRGLMWWTFISELKIDQGFRVSCVTPTDISIMGGFRLIALLEI